MIQRARILTFENRFRFGVSHASHYRHANQTGLLILEDDSGRVGCGEFLTREYVTGENLADAFALLETTIPQILKQPIDDPNNLLSAMDSLLDGRSGQQSAACAIDLALFDLCSKRSSVPVHRILAPDRETNRIKPYTAVLPLLSQIMLKIVANAYCFLLAPSQFKLKGSGEFARDRNALLAISDVVSEKAQILIDFNGALPLTNASSYLMRLKAVDPRLVAIEQPFPKGREIESRRLVAELSGELAVFGDESLCTEDDLLKAIEDRSFTGINLRIAKNGGLRKTFRLSRIAEGAGLQRQLGCYVGETSLLAAAALQFAATEAGLSSIEGGFSRVLLRSDLAETPLGLDSSRYNVERNDGFIGNIDLSRIKKELRQSRVLC
jgi:L-alanine-DL-glutamate epimerase-like enolase superfamily enzyme